MNLFKKALQVKQMKKESAEKTYNCNDFEVRRNTITGKLSVYHRETDHSNIEKDYEVFRKAVNIEDENDIIRYRLIALPGGRVAFGGYLDNYDVEKNEFYSFTDTWAKLFGKTWDLHTKLSKEDVLKIKKEFQERIGEAKFDSLYEIKYKEQCVGERAFEGSRYFITYSNGKKHILESFDSESSINLDYDILYYSKGSPFKIETIATPGNSRVYDKCKYTPNALRQIIKNHELEIEE